MITGNLECKESLVLFCETVSILASVSILLYKLEPSVSKLSLNTKAILAFFCQAQPKPKCKLEAEMAIFSIVTTTHPATHPPIRKSLNLASNNITAKIKVANLVELHL